MLQDVNALRLRCHVPDEYTPVDLNLRKGSAVFFDGHTVHGSYPNLSEQFRYALLMTYIARGAPFVAGRYAHREEIPIDDDLELSLLPAARATATPRDDYNAEL